MWEALSKDVNWGAVIAVVAILLVVAWSTGVLVPYRLVKSIVESHKQRADEAEKRAERWEAAWYKLYAAQQVRSASETTAVSEVALTLATTIEHLREATTGGEGNGVVPPPSND